MLPIFHRKNRHAVALLLFFSILLPSITQARQVKVGVYANKPLVYKDERGKFQGLTIDILRSAAKKYGWQLKFIEGTWPQCLERLDEEIIDLQVAIADSPSRRKIFDFTTTSLITNWGRVYSQERQHLDSLLALQGKTIAVLEGDIHARVFNDLMEKFDRQVTIKHVSSYNDVLQSIVDKTVDAGVVNRMYAMQNASRFAVSETPMIFNPIQVCYAAPKGKNKDILTALSKHLNELKADTGSIYYQSLEKWFGKQEQVAIPGWLINTLVMLSVLILFFLITMLVLKQQVAAKTRELRENQKKYQTLFSRSTDAIFVSDMEGRFIDVNDEACRCLGYTSEELLRMSAREVDPGILDEDRFTDLLELLNDGKRVTRESVHRRKDGSTFPIEVHLGKIKILGQDALLGLVRDITDRKRMEAERDLALHNLDSERERLTVTLRSIGDGVIATDDKGIIVFINRVTEQLTGWTEQEATGRPVEEVFNIVCENTGNVCDNPVHKVLEHGNSVDLADHAILIARDGTRRSISDSGAPIRDRDSNIIGTVLVFRDVTLEKKTEAELLKVKKLESIGVLAGGIAHDFNNILAAILGNINLAGQYIDTDSEAGILLKEAEKASTRAKQLTQQLLTFSKGGEPVKGIESLPQLIRESADFVLHGTNIVCEYRIPENLWMVEVDRGQIGQVIQNLVINSRHAMPEGGTITISGANIEDSNRELFQGLQNEKYVRISLYDTGVGIPEQMLEKIFDPYFTTKQEGSGLGLAISHSIIKKHRGHIQAHSRPGQGTTFTLYLPACTDQCSEKLVELETKAPAGGTILIMDDEEMFLDIATRMLEYLNFEVIATRDGEAVIAGYRRLMDDGVPVAAVILDLTIPGGMGGKEVVHEIRRINPSARVIASSGYSTDPIMANYQEYGFNGSIAKPFSLKELSRALNTALA